MRKNFRQSNCVISMYGQEIECREILLSMPPSENERLTIDWRGAQNALTRSYSKSRRALKNSTDYNRWLNFASACLKCGQPPKIEGDVGCILNVVFPDNKVRDAQNREKAFFDALEKSGCVIENDTNIVWHTTNKIILPRYSFILAYVFSMDAVKNCPFFINGDYLQTKSKEFEEIYGAPK